MFYLLLGPPKCLNGSVYNAYGTACPLTCDDPHPRICTKQCVRGCFCPTGMLQENSMCVTPDECKSMLGFYIVDCNYCDILFGVVCYSVSLQ